jgi:inorganic pyrophosphatase
VKPEKITKTYTILGSFLGKMVEVKIDRAKGSKHPKYGFSYDSNYGFVPNTMSPDGEET